MGPQSIARLLGVIQVFVSQLAIFYAQWAWMYPYHDEAVKESKWTAKTVIDYVNGPSAIWLRIETYAYYSYVLAISMYIAWIQVVSFWKNAAITDLNKQILDFIDYAHINITWWGFNMIKIALPLYLLFGMDDSANPKIPDRVKSGNIEFKWLMYVLAVTNVLQFLVNARIFVSDYKSPQIESVQKVTIDPTEDKKD